MAYIAFVYDPQFTLLLYFIFNLCAAELFVGIFHSFEAGIANAISSCKWMEKNNFISKK